MLGTAPAFREALRPTFHEALCKYRKGCDIPPILVRRYFEVLNFPERLATGKAALAAVGLTTHIPDDGLFRLEGPYSVKEHAFLLLEFARILAMRGCG